MKYLPIIAILLFASCNIAKQTERRDARRVVKAHIRNPKVTEDFCASIFSPRIDTFERISYIPGKPIITPGKTIMVDCDSIVKAGQKQGQQIDPKRVPVNCPPDTSQVDTALIERRVWQENAAQISTLKRQVDDEKNKTAAVEVKLGKKETWVTILAWAAGIGWLIIIASFAIRWFTGNRVKIV